VTTTTTTTTTTTKTWPLTPTPPPPSTSEIYLDVKSTMDGIQIIMKIPTVFNREGRMPRVHIS
jgi:hypothetical protein